LPGNEFISAEEPAVSIVDWLDEVFAELHVSKGIAHAAALALQSEEHDAMSVSYALEHVSDALGRVLDSLRCIEQWACGHTHG
jgi:hypothetical protein